LERRNARAIEFPQAGSHGASNQSNDDHLPLGHIGNLKCNPGYIFNPSELSGEVSKEINVVCMADRVCGGSGWKLYDGSDLPECIEGRKCVSFH
jgi:hypothetical protein